MRIWIVNHYALPPGGLGGPTRHLGLARALRDLGHEVVIHASIFDHYTRRDHRPRGSERVLIEDIDGVTYVWWSTPPYRSMISRVRNMAAFAVRVARSAPRLELPTPDVILGSSPHLLAAWAARRVATRIGVPFVLEVRDLWPQTFVDMGEIGARNPLVLALRRLERSLYRTADQIITVLPHAASYIASCGGDLTRISQVPNGVELSALTEPSPLSAGAPDHRIAVLYAGTLGHANGLEVAVDAAGELERRGRHDITVRLVGIGPERDALRDRASAHPDAISIDDPVPSSEVPALLATADVCLLVLRPSPVFRWGVSPTKLFDYMAAARPVIGAVSAPDDIVGPAGAGLWIEPGDPVGLADAIEQMADMGPERRAAMGADARRYVERHHSFAGLAGSLVEVLDRCVTTRERS